MNALITGAAGFVGSNLVRALNEVHSQGQGRTGFSELVGANRGQAGVPRLAPSHARADLDRLIAALKAA